MIPASVPPMPRTSCSDQEMFKCVREFNPYDLYSKTEERPNLEELRPYYEDLIAKYFPAQLNW
jgi:inositol oxygenase